MNLFGNIAKNTAAMLFATLLRMASSFVLVIFVARYLGSEGMGKFSFLISIFWLFQTIASMGLQPYFVREVSKNKSLSPKYLTHISFLSLLAALLMAFVMIVFVHVADYEADIRSATYLLGVGLLINTVNLVFHGMFIAHEKAEYVLISTTLENLGKLLTGMLLLFSGYGIVVLAGIIAAAPLIGFIINNYLYINKISSFSLKIDLNFARHIIRQIPTFSGISLFNALFWNADVLLLSKLGSMEALGFYSASLRIVGMIKLILQSYKTAIQPVAAKTFKISIKEFQDFCLKSLHYIFLITIPICIGGTLLADKIMVFFFSETFIQSSALLKIQIWLLIPYGMALVFASFLIASHHQKVDLRVNIISSLVLIALCLILIPRYGAVGAAISVVCAQTLFFLQQILFVSRHLFQVNFWQVSNKILLAGLIMGAVVYLLHPIHVIFNIIAGMAVFGVLIFLTGDYDLSEFKTLLKLRKS